MSSGKQLEWLQVIGKSEIRLFDTGRMSQLVRELSNPNKQYPSSILLIGGATRARALREIFPLNNLGKGSCDGVASLRVDNSSIYSDNPIFFAESNPLQKVPFVTKARRIDENESFPVQWALENEQLSSVLHARLFCLFADVVCVFADDFPSFPQVIDLLGSWAAVGSASDISVRLRVVILRHGDEATPSPAPTETDDMVSLGNFFSSIKVYCLASKELSPLARFGWVKGLFLKEMDEMRIIRRSLACLYSATHMSEFFRIAVAHTAASINQPFDFISTTRRGNEILPDFVGHVSRFLKLGEIHKVPRQALMKFIASTIMLDAYPPRMHAFNPESLFHAKYAQFCLQSLGEIYGNNHDLIQIQGALIRQELVTLVSDMRTYGKSAIQMHQENTNSLNIDWSRIKSNETCLCCLRRAPENTLSCGHAICDSCVRNLGHETSNFDCQYQIDACMLCHLGQLLIGLRPLTAGLRILSVDGGGTRGVIIVGFMEIFQNLLGETWKIQDLFDSAYGTSVGGLIVLYLFVCQQPVSECAMMFDKLSRQLFPQSSNRSIFSRLRRMLRSWYYDGCHDANILETSLKEHFGSDSRLFGHSRGLTAIKVGVTAATIDNGSPLLLTNYNGLIRSEEKCGYKVVRPEEIEDEVRIWEAGRITSAAPVLYPPAYTRATGCVQDGGMGRHNNPIKLSVWETKRLQLSNTCQYINKPDFVLSLGTGMKKDRNYSKDSYHVLFNGFIPRLWRAYMSSFDGESNFNDVVNALDPERHGDYRRLNVELPSNEPAIDNTTRMDELRRLVDCDPMINLQCENILYNLLIATFYFELSGIPIELPLGGISCTGMIRCRLPSKVIVELLERIHPLGLSFATKSSMLGYYNSSRDICPSCHRYRKFVEFTAKDLGQLMTIRVQSPNMPLRNISAFPQSMRWFVDQQHLDAPFGTAYHRNFNHACKSCSEGIKRKIAVSCTSPRKRRRVSN